MYPFLGPLPSFPLRVIEIIRVLLLYVIEELVLPVDIVIVVFFLILGWWHGQEVIRLL